MANDKANRRASAKKPTDWAKEAVELDAHAEKLKKAGMPRMSKSMAKSADSARARSNGITPKRQAAIDAYKATLGQSPPSSMSAKAIQERVARFERQKRQMQAIADNMAAHRPDWVGPRSSTEFKAPDDLGVRPPTPRPVPYPGHSDGAFRGVTNDTHMGTTSHAPASSPAGPGRLARAGEFLSENAGRINTGLAVTAAGVAAAQGYSRAKAEGKSSGEAVVEGAKSAALPAALAAAPAIAKVGQAVGDAGKFATHAGFEFLGSTSGLFDNFFGLAVGSKMVMGGGLAWGAGRVVQAAGTVGAKVAAPAIAGYQAFQGYKSDGVRGAVKGAVTAFDPTELATIAGAKQGVVGWGFDKAFGSKDGTAGRAALSGPDTKKFAAANAGYAAHHMTGHAEPSAEGRRGWANPAVQKAAQEARGVQNVTDWAQSADPKRRA